MDDPEPVNGHKRSDELRERGAQPDLVDSAWNYALWHRRRIRCARLHCCHCLRFAHPERHRRSR